MTAGFEPPAGIDDWYVATARELAFVRLNNGPADVTRALLGALRDETACYAMLVCLAREIGAVFDHPSRDGGPVGERTAIVTRAIVPIPLEIARDCRIAAQLIGAGARADHEIAGALALAVVRGPDGVSVARRVSRIMLDILATEPLALTGTPTPKDPS